MRAIILAAGSAKRLRPLTADRPKCMLEVGGKPILHYQLAALEAVGVGSVVAVVGWHWETFAAFEDRVTTVRNDVYDTTNSLYSFWLAKGHLDDELLLLNSDVLFGEKLLQHLISCSSEDALLVDPDARLDDEAMKVQVQDGRVAAMSKELQATSAFGENLGVIKLSREGARDLWAAADATIGEGELRAWLPYGIDAICEHRHFAALACGSHPWIEIDTPQDLKRAEEDVLPLLNR